MRATEGEGGDPMVWMGRPWRGDCLTGPDQFMALQKTLAGQGITWTAQPGTDGKYLFIDVVMPKQVINAVVKRMSHEKQGG